MAKKSKSKASVPYATTVKFGNQQQRTRLAKKREGVKKP